MAQRGERSVKNPGVVLAIIFFALLALVFLTWPQRPWGGMALVGWLLLALPFVYFILGVIYILWMRRWERKRAQGQGGGI